MITKKLGQIGFKALKTRERNNKLTALRDLSQAPSSPERPLEPLKAVL